MDAKTAAVVALVLALSIGGIWYFTQKKEDTAAQGQPVAPVQVAPAGSQPQQGTPVDPYSNYSAPAR